MIRLLITLLKNKYLLIISFLKNNLKQIAAIIFMVLAAICFYQHKVMLKLNELIDRLTNNYEYYMNLNDSIKTNNKTLLLTLDEYKETNDSLIKEIKDTQNKLKIKDKHLKLVLLLKLEVKHDTTIIVKSTDFNLTIRPNKLTTICINKLDTLLNHKLNILNDLTLFLFLKRVYKRKYKNWFSRLLHFDFKKKNQVEYRIDNSNNLIEVTDTKLVEIYK